MSFAKGNLKVEEYVVFRPAKEARVGLNFRPHPMDPNPNYEPKPIQLAVRKSQPPGPDDLCRNSRPENGRGFTLTERYFL